MNNKNQQIVENSDNICNHYYNDINNTLTGIPKIKMVVPTKYYLQCKECGEVFTISENQIENIQDFMRRFFN